MTPQNPPHMRRNVWTLPSGDPTLDEYASAVEIMKGRPAQDPTSWSYQAAIHGTHTTPTKPLWNGCQRGSWFFLSWHRAFLYYFEQIVRAAVVQAGGSANWSLPYWNYGAGGQQATLPLAFRSPNVGGQPNPLFTSRRDPGINAGLALSPAVASATFALSRPRFTGIAQFGGGITPAQQFSGSTGRLEQTPHNDVHDSVGGWMGDIDQAAMDPIFWLHHCNIDRLWHVWNRSNPSGHKDPSDPRWTGHAFSFFDVHGHKVHKTGADVVDIRVKLGYVYEEEPHAIAPGPPAPPPPAPAPDEQEVAMTSGGGGGQGDERQELVGASEQPLELVGTPAEVTAVYVSIWVAFGGLLVLVSPLWSSVDPAVVAAVPLALAAAWQLTPHKRRALLDCHRPSPLPPRGRRATAGVVRFASLNGLACVRSCWAMMLAMAVASSLTFFWMVAITGLVTTEKLAQKPRQASRAAAVVLAAGALLAAVI
jgi:hypothetical protein